MYRGGGGGGGEGRGGPRGGGGRGAFRGGPGGAPGEGFAANRPARPDQRLAGLDELINSFKMLDVGPDMPLRPGFGTAGRAITLRANFFALKLPTKMQIHDYRVAISPKAKLNAPVKAQIFALLERSPELAPHMGYVAHDRSERLVSARPLPQPLALSLPFFDEGEDGPRPGAPVYNIEIELDKELNTSDIQPHLQGKDRDFDVSPLISALNLVLQKHALQSGGIRVGQSKYFFPNTERFGLALGLEARRGFFMSVRPTFRSLMVNVNVSMAAFYSTGNLAKAMFAFRERTRAIPRDFFQKVKIITRHLGYPKKRAIWSIMDTTARTQRFRCDEYGGQVSVEEYFRRKHPNITLQHAHDLPVVNIGSKDRPVYLPAEICEIAPDQPYRGLLKDDAVRQMIKVACNPPSTNANFITQQGLPLLGLAANPPAGSTLEQFGLAVNQEMEVVPARVLAPPQILYGQGRPDVRDGGWNIVNVKFRKGGIIAKWAVLLVCEGSRDEFKGPGDPELDSFLKTFRQKCVSSGMQVVPGPPTIMQTPRLPAAHGDGRQPALNIIKDTLVNNLDGNNKPSFVLVLLSGVDKFIYPGIKRLCDMTLGLHTVCMLLLPTKARVPDPKKLDQYFSNVALKVNTKLNGVNHSLDAESLRWTSAKRTMLVGIDVTHPSPTSLKGSPSIAAVVASADDKLAQYPVSLRLQTNRNVSKDAEEMVQDLTAMMVERLVLFRDNVKGLPERVIVFRDGVSEGQYKLVLEKELPQILKAFEKLQCKPKLSILVCGKRHHARFPATGADHATRNGNTVPGTVVDQGVTDIYGFDFYLQAHAGLMGTVRPTHYFVVHDQNGLTADQIQKAVHDTSYTYVRATKAVSLVPPAYYADLACERARHYLGALLDADDRGSVATSTRGRRADSERERREVYDRAVRMWGEGVHADLRNSMFYI